MEIRQANKSFPLNWNSGDVLRHKCHWEPLVRWGNKISITPGNVSSRSKCTDRLTERSRADWSPNLLLLTRRRLDGRATVWLVARGRIWLVGWVVMNPGIGRITITLLITSKGFGVCPFDDDDPSLEQTNHLVRVSVICLRLLAQGDLVGGRYNFQTLLLILMWFTFPRRNWEMGSVVVTA